MCLQLSARLISHNWNKRVVSRDEMFIDFDYYSFRKKKSFMFIIHSIISQHYRQTWAFLIRGFIVFFVGFCFGQLRSFQMQMILYKKIIQNVFRVRIETVCVAEPRAECFKRFIAASSLFSKCQKCHHRNQV